MPAEGTEHRKLAAIMFTDMGGYSAGWAAQARVDRTPNSPKMEPVNFIARQVEIRLRSVLARQKSVLLLGPRQTGKTTLLERLHPDILLNFLRPEVRQRYERAPQL